MTFRTTVLLGGKTATGLQVPDDVVEALGAGRRPAVKVTVAGHTYRTTVAARGGIFLIPLSAENRTAANVNAGDEVEVDIELDGEPRVVTLPDDLARALATDREALQRFEKLAFTHQNEFVRWIESAKRPETRERRISEAVAMIHDGRTRS
jgi:antitoxin component of MazEF toxin-antitoxin module